MHWEAQDPGCPRFSFEIGRERDPTGPVETSSDGGSVAAHGRSATAVVSSPASESRHTKIAGLLVADSESCGQRAPRDESVPRRPCDELESRSCPLPVRHAQLASTIGSARSPPGPQSGLATRFEPSTPTSRPVRSVRPRPVSSSGCLGSHVSILLFCSVLFAAVFPALRLPVVASAASVPALEIRPPAHSSGVGGWSDFKEGPDLAEGGRFEWFLSAHQLWG